jgi:N-methylhydantoinase B
LPFLIKKILNKVSLEEIRQGDIIITNQLDIAGSHLPDVKIVKPIYYKGELVMWAGSLGHWADIGGMVPGSYSHQATETYQEGLQIPPSRLMKEGKMDQEIFEFILLNTRGREDRIGDLWGQISACNVAERRIHELFNKYGKRAMLQYFNDVVGHSEHRMRKEIEKIPVGIYEFEDVLDDDGVVDKPIKIKVQIKSKGDSIEFDFTGTDPQAKGPLNLTYYPTISSVLYVMRCITDPTIPLNEGTMRPIEVYAPEGTILNAKYPAPTVGWHETCHRIVDVLLGAFSIIIPNKVIAACYGSSGIFIIGGIDSRTGKQFQHYEAVAGGFGARPNKDGIDGIRTHIGNTANIPVEVMETSLPVLVERYGIVMDSGGTGKYRGGCGLEKRVKLLGEATASFMLERVKNPPYGLFGGKPGKKAAVELFIPGEEGKILKTGKLSIELPKGSVISFRTAGSGGYGNAMERELELVQRDIINEKISIKSAEHDFGVVIDQLTHELDKDATWKVRSNRKTK